MEEMFIPKNDGRSRRSKNPPKTRGERIAELANYIEAGGPGRMDEAVSKRAIEEDWKTFTAEERTGFLTMRHADIQRLCEDYADNLEAGEVLRFDASGLLLTWDGKIAHIGFHDKHDDVDNFERIAESTDMKTLVEFYRKAEERIEYESQNPPVFEGRILN